MGKANLKREQTSDINTNNLPSTTKTEKENLKERILNKLEKKATEKKQINHNSNIPNNNEETNSISHNNIDNKEQNFIIEEKLTNQILPSNKTVNVSNIQTKQTINREGSKQNVIYQNDQEISPKSKQLTANSQIKQNEENQYNTNKNNIFINNTTNHEINNKDEYDNNTIENLVNSHILENENKEAVENFLFEFQTRKQEPLFYLA